MDTKKRKLPVLEKVHGDAFAGGCEVALACDMIVAGDQVRFGLPEVKRSLVALAGGLVALPRIIGEKLALEMALTGEPFTAARLPWTESVGSMIPLLALPEKPRSFSR